jgi:prepilin-type N-terminal cleavage/methylation domain-containing protein
VRRGFNLLELVIAMAMLLGFLVIILMTLHRGGRFVQETQSYGLPQKEGAVILRKLRDELSNSHRRYVILGENGASIRFLSLENPSNQVSRLEFDNLSGLPIWKKWVAYAWNSEDREVMRFEVPLDVPTSRLDHEPPPNLLPTELSTHPRCTTRTMARGVTNFEILRTGNAKYTILTEIEQEVSVSTRRNRPERVKVIFDTTVVILNDDEPE